MGQREAGEEDANELVRLVEEGGTDLRGLGRATSEASQEARWTSEREREKQGNLSKFPKTGKQKRKGRQQARGAGREGKERQRE